MDIKDFSPQSPETPVIPYGIPQVFIDDFIFSSGSDYGINDISFEDRVACFEDIKKTLEANDCAGYRAAFTKIYPEFTIERVERDYDQEIVIVTTASKVRRNEGADPRPSTFKLHLENTRCDPTDDIDARFEITFYPAYPDDDKKRFEYFTLEGSAELRERIERIKAAQRPIS